MNAKRVTSFAFAILVSTPLLAGPASAQSDRWEDCTFRLKSAHLSGRQPSESKANNAIVHACTHYIQRYTKNKRMLSSAYSARGDAFAGKGDMSRAMADWNKAIEFDPANHRAYESRGLALFDREEFAYAIRDLTTAIDLSREKSGGFIFWKRGAAHIELKNYKQAIEDLTESLEFNNTDFVVAGRLKDRSYAYYHDQQFERAVADINRSEQLDSRSMNWRWYYLRADSCERIGNRECAAASYKKMYEVAPQEFSRDAIKARVEQLGGRM